MKALCEHVRTDGVERKSSERVWRIALGRIHLDEAEYGTAHFWYLQVSSPLRRLRHFRISAIVNKQRIRFLEKGISYS